LSTGEVRCWGNNDSGQLGGGSVLGATPSAVYAQGITTATHVDIGDDFALAVLADGSLLYWGAAVAAVPGDGVSTQPVSVSGF